MNYLCVCLFSVNGSVKSNHKVCGAAPGVLAEVTASWLGKFLTKSKWEEAFQCRQQGLI